MATAGGNRVRAHLFTFDSLCFFYNVVDLLQGRSEEKKSVLRNSIRDFTSLPSRMQSIWGEGRGRRTNKRRRRQWQWKRHSLNEANVVRSILCDFCLAPVHRNVFFFPRITFSCALLHPRIREESFARARCDRHERMFSTSIRVASQANSYEIEKRPHDRANGKSNGDRKKKTKTLWYFVYMQNAANIEFIINYWIELKCQCMAAVLPISICAWHWKFNEGKWQRVW